MRIFSSILAIRHEKVFICLCPYFQTSTLTGASHNPRTEKNSIHHSGTDGQRYGDDEWQ
jgi:hypothetical protein